ncbi:Uncharacterised protein [Acinetobacter baumannii]|nr:Uncharacterised protein [Acinetobacter baumannii]
MAIDLNAIAALLNNVDIPAKDQLAGNRQNCRVTLNRVDLQYHRYCVQIRPDQVLKVDDGFVATEYKYHLIAQVLAAHSSKIVF